jgi:hypothetical protein
MSQTRSQSGRTDNAAIIENHFATMKNDIIGHELRKAAAIEDGICENLVQALSLNSRGKSRATNENGDAGRRVSTASDETLLEEDQLRLQAIFIINSLANGK